MHGVHPAPVSAGSLRSARVRDRRLNGRGGSGGGAVILLTFDTDYLSPQDLTRFAESFPIPGHATFFLWQPFSKLDLGPHEIGLHPFLSETESWRDTLVSFMDELGDRPAVLRPHSCAYAHTLGVTCAKLGFRAISQATYLYRGGLEPYRHPWGLWELPIYYMDSMDFTFSTNWPRLDHEPFSREILLRSIHDDALFLYDFHPLHLILNTSSLPEYQSLKSKIVDQGASPYDMMRSGRGAQTFYLELVELMEHSGIRSRTCSELLDQL